MKRTMKKLVLSRESLRNLAAAELTKVAGGRSVDSFCVSRCGPVFPAA